MAERGWKVKLRAPSRRSGGHFLAKKDEAVQWFQDESFDPTDFINERFAQHSEKDLDQARHELSQLNEYCKQEVQKVVQSHHKSFLDASHGIHEVETLVDELRNYVSGSAAVVANLEALPSIAQQLPPADLVPEQQTGAAQAQGGSQGSSTWSQVSARQAELEQELEVAVAERDFVAARALLAAGRDMISVVERDAAVLGRQASSGGPADPDWLPAWRHGLEGRRAAQRAAVVGELQRQLGATNSSTLERRYAAQMLCQLAGPGPAAQALLRCHSLRVRAEQQHLLRQHSTASGDPDGVEYAGGLAQRTFLAIGAAAEDVAAVFPTHGSLSNPTPATAHAPNGDANGASPLPALEPLPAVSALLSQWAGEEAQCCAGLLVQHALTPFAATGAAVGALLCCGLALVFCVALEGSHGLSLRRAFEEGLWASAEAIVRRQLQRLCEDAAAVTSVDATNAALRALRGGGLVTASSGPAPAAAAAASATGSSSSAAAKRADAADAPPALLNSFPGAGLPPLHPLPPLPTLELEGLNGAAAAQLPGGAQPPEQAAPAGLSALPLLLPELRALAEGLAPFASVAAVGVLRQGVLAAYGAVCEAARGSLARLVEGGGSSGSGGRDALTHGSLLAGYLTQAEQTLRLYAEADLQAALEPLAGVAGPVAPPELLLPSLEPIVDMLASLPPPPAPPPLDEAPGGSYSRPASQETAVLVPAPSFGLLERVRAEEAAEQDKWEARERTRAARRASRDARQGAAAALEAVEEPAREQSPRAGRAGGKQRLERYGEAENGVGAAGEIAAGSPRAVPVAAAPGAGRQPEAVEAAARPARRSAFEEGVGATAAAAAAAAPYGGARPQAQTDSRGAQPLELGRMAGGRDRYGGDADGAALAAQTDASQHQRRQRRAMAREAEEHGEEEEEEHHAYLPPPPSLPPRRGPPVRQQEWEEEQAPMEPKGKTNRQGVRWQDQDPGNDTNEEARSSPDRRSRSHAQPRPRAGSRHSDDGTMEEPGDTEAQRQAISLAGERRARSAPRGGRIGAASSDAARAMDAEEGGRTGRGQPESAARDAQIATRVDVQQRGRTAAERAAPDDGHPPQTQPRRARQAAEWADPEAVEDDEPRVAATPPRRRPPRESAPPPALQAATLEAAGDEAAAPAEAQPDRRGRRARTEPEADVQAAAEAPRPARAAARAAAALELPDQEPEPELRPRQRRPLDQTEDAAQEPGAGASRPVRAAAGSAATAAAARRAGGPGAVEDASPATEHAISRRRQVLEEEEEDEEQQRQVRALRRPPRAGARNPEGAPAPDEEVPSAGRQRGSTATNAAVGRQHAKAAPPVDEPGAGRAVAGRDPRPTEAGGSDAGGDMPRRAAAPVPAQTAGAVAPAAAAGASAAAAAERRTNRFGVVLSDDEDGAAPALRERRARGAGAVAVTAAKFEELAAASAAPAAPPGAGATGEGRASKAPAKGVSGAGAGTEGAAAGPAAGRRWRPAPLEDSDDDRMVPPAAARRRPPRPADAGAGAGAGGTERSPRQARTAAASRAAQGSPARQPSPTAPAPAARNRAEDPSAASKPETAARAARVLRPPAGAPEAEAAARPTSRAAPPLPAAEAVPDAGAGPQAAPVSRPLTARERLAARMAARAAPLSEDEDDIPMPSRLARPPGRG